MEKKEGKEQKEKSKTLRPSIDFDFCPNKNVVKRDASGTKGMLSCCKCLFEYMCIAANLAHIQAENVSNVQKCDFWQWVDVKF